MQPRTRPSARAKGVACVTADDFRWKKAHIKSTSLPGAVLARQISADVGAAETVMFRDGCLSEARGQQCLGGEERRGGRRAPKDNLVLKASATA